MQKLMIFCIVAFLLFYNFYIKTILLTNNFYGNKKLSCRRETAQRFVSLNILLSHSKLFEMTLLSRACVSLY